MKRNLFGISLFCLILSTAGCNDDAYDTYCGNGALEPYEICDGRYFQTGVKVCPTGLVLKENALFACTETCTLDISQACEVPACENECEKCEKCENECENNTPSTPTTPTTQCGNNTLDDDETCDGDQIREDAKTCPTGMRLRQDPVFGCSDTCTLDTSNACENTQCGDNILDPNEECENIEGNPVFTDGKKQCKDENYTPLQGRDLFKCSEYCTVISDNACRLTSGKEPTLYFSEFLAQSGPESTVSQHLYIEIGNLGDATTLEDCKLVGLQTNTDDPSKLNTESYVFEYPLTNILNSSIENPNNVLAVCYQNKDGWIQSQYDEKTMTYDEYLVFLETAQKSKIACEIACAKIPECITACAQAYDTITTSINEAAIQARQIDNACDLYIPAGNKSLELSNSKSAYNVQNYWGLALICGTLIHDAVQLRGLSHSGANRYCPKDALDSIKNTADIVREGEYFATDKQSGLFDKPQNRSSSTPGYAACGSETIN